MEYSIRNNFGVCAWSLTSLDVFTKLFALNTLIQYFDSIIADDLLVLLILRDKPDKNCD